MREKITIIAAVLWIMAIISALLMFLHISGIALLFTIIFWVAAILSVAGRDRVLSITTTILVIAMVIGIIALPGYIKPGTPLASPWVIISVYVAMLSLFLILLGRSIWVLYKKLKKNNIT